MLNELTKRLYAEGWTRDHHPDDVFWGDWENFAYKWERLITMTWETPCGLCVDGRSVGSCDTTYMGVWYCPENGNPTIRCPYERRDCPHQPEGLELYCRCVCRRTEQAYDYEHSAEKAEHERDRKRHEQYMEITGGQYCACVHHGNGYNGGLVQIKYDVQTCISIACKNEFCSIRKQPRDLRRVNIYYDIRRTEITRIGFLEEKTQNITKGVKVFEKPVARTDAEIWLASKRASYDPFREKQVIAPKLTLEDRRKEFYSKNHRLWPDYDYFEIDYEVENIRIEARESRDLLQDLHDVAEGITVVHASDQEKAAKAQKSEAREARQKAKIARRRRKREAARPAPVDEQMSLFEEG